MPDHRATTDMYGTPRRFPTTHWSFIEAVGGEAVHAQDGLTQLLKIYMPPLKTYLVEMRQLSPDLADDLLQSFVVDKVLEDGLIKKAQRERGRFRTFLLACLNNFVRDYFRRQSTAKRLREVSIPDLENVDTLVVNPLATQRFEMEWARAVLEQTLERMRGECQEKDRPDLWGVFEGRILLPYLHGGDPESYEKITQRLSFSSPLQASNALITANRMFVRLMRSVISTYEIRSDEIDEELRDVKRILSSAQDGSAE